MKIAISSTLLVLALALSTGSKGTYGAAPGLHLQLDSALPHPDSTVVAPVTGVHLFFSEEPQLAPSSIRVVRADDTLVEMGEVVAREGDPAVLHAPVVGETPAGRYRVVWRTMGADGHVVSGDYAFQVRSADPAERR